MRFESLNVCAGGYFPLGAKTCIVWATMDVLLCTASIWHMATISVDRYCSLRFPLRYRRTQTPFFVIAKIAFVWIVSIGICSPLAVAGFVNPLNVYRGGQCAPAVPQFVIYGSIFAFFVPLVLMLVSYALTVRTLTNQAIGRRQERRRSAQLELQAATQDGMVHLTTANSPWITRISSKVSLVCLDPRSVKEAVVGIPQEANGDILSTQEPRDGTTDVDCVCYEAPHDATDGPATDKNGVPSLHHRTDPRQQSFSTKIRRRKRKATRVLGLMFLVFVMLWTPFFVLNLLSAVCPRCVEESVESNVWTVLVWLGWISSSANPIIYTSFSPLFRSAFKHVLICRCENRSSVVRRRQRQWLKRLKDHRIRTESQDKHKDKFYVISVRHVN